MEDEYAQFSKIAMDDEEISSFVPEAISVVGNVLDKCKEEFDKNELHAPLDQFAARACYYTNYPPWVISKLLKEYISGKASGNFDVAQRIIFIRILQNFYLQEKNPTYSDVYELAKTSIPISSFDQFRSEMCIFGFYYIPTTTGYILTEDPKIRFDRFNFLHRIKKVRAQGTPMYYIDERLIDAKQMFKRPGKVGDKEFILKDDHFLLLHAISAKEVKNSLLSNVVSREVFKKWIFDVLIKSLTPKCVIIMDNHQIHGKLVTNQITRYHTKEEMLKILRINNVPCNEDMHKAELYELSQKFTRKEKFYDLDKILKAFGYEVLRIPFGCKNLSVTQLLWSHLNTSMNTNECVRQGPAAIKEYMHFKINEVLNEKWDYFESMIINWENELLSLDIMTEKILDKSFQIDVDKILANEDKLYEL